MTDRHIDASDADPDLKMILCQPPLIIAATVQCQCGELLVELIRYDTALIAVEYELARAIQEHLRVPRSLRRKFRLEINGEAVTRENGRLPKTRVGYPRWLDTAHALTVRCPEHGSASIPAPTIRDIASKTASVATTEMRVRCNG